MLAVNVTLLAGILKLTVQFSVFPFSRNDTVDGHTGVAATPLTVKPHVGKNTSASMLLLQVVVTLTVSPTFGARFGRGVKLTAMSTDCSAKLLLIEPVAGTDAKVMILSVLEPATSVPVPPAPGLI